MRTIKLLLAALFLSSVAMAQTPPPASEPTRTLGGCNKIGTFCAGPSVLLSLTAYNLTTGSVEAAFVPGVGYGFTVHPKDWWAAGLDVYVAMQTGPAPGVQFSLIAKFANYIRVGFARQTGHSHAWYIPIGLGVDLP